MKRTPLERFLEFSIQKKIRKTTQREIIVKTAFSTKKHFTAEELLVEVRRIYPKVSRATVYRTLPLLVEAGLLAEHDFGGPSKVYDPNIAERPNHNHLICEDCEKIVEFEDEELERRENLISKKLGFLPSKKTLQIRASCEKFRKFGKCDSQK